MVRFISYFPLVIYPLISLQIFFRVNAQCTPRVQPVQIATVLQHRTAELEVCASRVAAASKVLLVGSWCGQGCVRSLPGVGWLSHWVRLSFVLSSRHRFDPDPLQMAPDDTQPQRPLGTPPWVLPLTIYIPVIPTTYNTIMQQRRITNNKIIHKN